MRRVTLLAILCGCGAVHPVPVVQCPPGQTGDVAYGDGGYARCGSDPTAWPDSMQRDAGARR